MADAELRGILEKTKLLVGKNNEDSGKLQEEIAIMKEKHCNDASVARKKWRYMTSRLFEEVLDEMLMQKDDALARKVQSIRRDVKEVSQRVESISAEMKNSEECHVMALRFKSEIEENLSKCNLKEKEVLILKAESVKQSESKFQEELTDLLIKKLLSLVDKVVDVSRTKDGNDGVGNKGM